MFHGRDRVFDAVCDHEDVVTVVPEGATVLAANDNASVQALTLPTAGSDFWGVQYHPDFSVDYLEAIGGYRGQRWIELGWLADADHLAYLMGSFRRLRERDPAAGWAVGVTTDILDDECRVAEVAAWLEHRVRTPHMGGDHAEQ
jgi:GMP synthase (glutamine-hydrolysing)